MSASVTIYTSPTCGYCHMAKQYLSSRSVAFNERDITTDSEAYQDVIDTTGQLGVPVIDIEGSMIVGFDRPKIDILLRQKKLI